MLDPQLNFRGVMRCTATLGVVGVAALATFVCLKIPEIPCTPVAIGSLLTEAPTVIRYVFLGSLTQDILKAVAIGAVAVPVSKAVYKGINAVWENVGNTMSEQCRAA